MLRGEEAGPPEALEEGLGVALRTAMGDQHDVAGKILIVATQPVIQPGPHAGATRLLVTGLEEGHRGVVIDLLGIHRLDEAHVVGDLRHMRHQFAHPDARLPILLELELRRDNGELVLTRGHPGKALAAPDGFRQIGAVLRVHLGLIVEHVLLRGAARLKQVDNTLRAWGEVGMTKKSAAFRHRFFDGGVTLPLHKRGEGRRANARACTSEELSTGQVHRVVFEVHGVNSG